MASIFLAPTTVTARSRIQKGVRARIRAYGDGHGISGRLALAASEDDRSVTVANRVTLTDV